MTQSLSISTDTSLDANSTASQAAPSKALSLLIAVAIAIAAAQPPVVAVDPAATVSVKAPAVYSTTSSWTALSPTPIDVHAEVEHALVGLATKLAREQVDLSPEDSALLYRNLWQLYG